MNLTSSDQGPVVDFCEHGNEPSGFNEVSFLNIGITTAEEDFRPSELL
jgi:hypothetical protein